MYKIVYEIHEIRAIAETVLRMAPSKVIAFHGAMGAGKTTLIKELLQVLGSDDSSSSPTFGIVNEYENNHGVPLAYHFDFYRLEDEFEALDMGVEEYFNSDLWIFMEWPEKIKSLIPENTTTVHLKICTTATRELSIEQ